MNNWRHFNGNLLLILLVFCPSVFASQDIREIKVTAAVSPTFKHDPDWKQDIQERLLFANKVFDPSFQIHFSIQKYIAWEPEDETRETDLLIEELRSFIPLGEDEIIIGFHKMSQPFSKEKVVDYHILGTSRSFHGIVVIRDPFGKWGRLYKDVVMVHEIGHLFGAVHVSEKNALMHATMPSIPAMTFDTDNHRVVSLARDVDFRKGEETLSREAIDGMVQIYEKLIRRHPHSDFYYQLGHFYRMREEPAKAVSIWEEAVRVQYDNPHIHRELGFHYYRSARYKQAVRELGAAVAHFILPSQRKQKANAFNFLGAAYYEQGNLEQAIFSWLQGLTADPDDPILQGNLAVAYLQSGNADRGIAELEKLVAKDPNDATTLSNLGVAWIRLGKYESGIMYLRRALKVLKPRNESDLSQGKKTPSYLDEISEAGIRLDLGAAYLALGSWEEAIAELQHSVRLDSDNYEVHRNLAHAYVRSGTYPEAIKEIEIALRYRKDDPYLYAFLAESYASSDQAVEAVKAARDGLRYAKGELAAVFHRNIAALYAAEGRFAEAIGELKSSLNKHWKDAEAHTHLGMLQARGGQLENARRSLKTALRMDPENERAKKALESLEETLKK